MAQSENAPGSAGRRQLQDILKTRILSAVTVMSHSPSLENIQDALTGRQEKAGNAIYSIFFKTPYYPENVLLCRKQLDTASDTPCQNCHLRPFGDTWSFCFTAHQERCASQLICHREPSTAPYLRSGIRHFQHCSLTFRIFSTEFMAERRRRQVLYRSQNPPCHKPSETTTATLSQQFQSLSLFFILPWKLKS